MAGECWFTSNGTHEKLRYRAAKVVIRLDDSLDS